MGFFDVFKQPDRVFEEAKPNATLVGGVKRYGIFGIVVGLIIAIAILALGTLLIGLLTILPGINIAGMTGALGIFSVIMLVILPITYAISLIIGMLIMAIVIWIISKVFNGTGKLEDNYYLLSIPLWPVLVGTIILMVIVGILAFIPLIGIIIGALLMILYMIYIFYINIVAVAHANNISKLKSLGIFIILGIIYVLVMALLGGAMLMSMTPAVPIA